MKVAFVNHPTRVFAPPPQDGSIEIWIHEVARRLAQSCEVIVYSPRGSLPKEEWCDGVQYRRVSAKDRIDRAIRGIQLLRGGWRATAGLQSKMLDFRSWLYYIEYALGVAKDLRSQRCDVIHVVNLSQFVPILHALNPAAKIVLHMHCEWLTRIDPGVIERRLRHADRIIGCSDFVTDKIRKAFPRYSSRCLTVYNGASLQLFIPGPGRRTDRNSAKRVVFVGRVSPEKGLHVLLDAFAIVAERFPLARLEIVGPDVQFSLDVLPTICSASEFQRLSRFYDGKGYRTHLEEQARSVGLGDKIVWRGPVRHSDLPLLYQKADVSVLPTTANELFPLAVAEAMSAGVPAVATHVGGVPELIEDGKTGILVEPNNPEELAKAILRLLEDESLRRSMGQAARQRATSLLSWDGISQEMLRIYNGLESNNGGRISRILPHRSLKRAEPGSASGVHGVAR